MSGAKFGLFEWSVCPVRGRWYKDGCWLVCGLSQRLLSDDLFWPPCFILLCPLLFVLANGSVHVDGRAFGNMAPPSESTLLHVPLTPVHPRSRGGIWTVYGGGFDETETRGWWGPDICYSADGHFVAVD